tara:strand:- start:233 stop:697 length:465 start_codon:yes stop_codon:yes gene_type:complete
MGRAIDDLNPHMQETVESVYRMIEEITGVSKARLLMKCSRRTTVDARKILVNILRNHTKLTLYALAKELNKDHGTIMHYEKLHRNHMHEAEYRRMYSAVSGMYANSTAALVHDSIETQCVELQELETEFNALQFKMSEFADNIKKQAALLPKTY